MGSVKLPKKMLFLTPTYTFFQPKSKIHYIKRYFSIADFEKVHHSAHMRPGPTPSSKLGLQLRLSSGNKRKWSYLTFKKAKFLDFRHNLPI